MIRIAFAKEGGGYFANSELKFGVSSQDKCEEDREYLTETLGNFFHEITNVQCLKEDFETYFQASAKIPIVRTTESRFTSIPGLLNISVTPGEKIRLGLYLSPEHFRSLKEIIKEKYWNTINIEEFSLSWVIINDTKDNVILTATSVYVNTKPIPGSSEIELKSKSKTTILVSNVLKDYIFENGTSSFLSFESKQKAAK
ncbi:hypothetical protein EHQ12_08625 [Leptospira gomenensis]|uniref:DUF7424 domain-containing protein n=2 Tax=Leptospira gomenensis TaxID=2484974 RepID=A0A5F1Y565_9LEPT|nr:hypothetical protein [Leptospira gomenensis]TGK27553.1 hypothetical protein EHQ17_19485 [Leptospira gomenensis]TGK39878.1 hypothetical protein EHQ12_08625 [Leptospira gomenensis]TGK42634.1 hypothetical protein EHQ07_14585 [Leptospira gomenensis]TGK65797.1 hypothetical protein EHQ13_04690 [Leptospira gomenensis]